MFATDRDLLIFEPNLFRDVSWTSQRLCQGTATIASSIMTIAGADVALDDAGITAGHVAFIGGTPYEIIERLSPTTARLSRLRVDPHDDPIPVGPVATAVACSVFTFAPQIAMVHRQVLPMLGIEPGAASAPGQPAETDITNPAAFTRLECLGALHLIYSAAGSLTAADSPTNQRAEFYRQRFAQERERTAAEIDLNGDGLPDATRRLNVVYLLRA
jgi:hypothetical protein